MHNKKIITIIPARGGSKGIKKKNLINFYGKPLIYWTIKQSLSSKKISSVWVTSDDNQILNYSKKIGANTILRPKKFATNNSKSEEAWLHAIKEIKKKINFDIVVTPQPTSPIRGNKDFDNAINFFIKGKYNSLFSAEIINDYFIWEIKNKKINPLNYSLKKRQMRQKISQKFHENGSFYIFETSGFLKNKIRLFGKIGIYLMDHYKSNQIDDVSDLFFCETIMNAYKNKLK